MVPLFLVPALAVLFFYFSTFRSMCAAPNMAVFCSSLMSWFPGMSLTYFLNDLEMVPVAELLLVLPLFLHSTCTVFLLWGFILLLLLLLLLLLWSDNTTTHIVLCILAKISPWSGHNSNWNMLERKLWLKCIINSDVHFVGCLYIMEVVKLFFHIHVFIVQRIISSQIDFLMMWLWKKSWHRYMQRSVSWMQMDWAH
jgi:hypothetical protein